MSLVPMKCPNCGASIMLDAANKEGFCSYCGSKLKTQEIVNRVKIDNTEDVDNYLALAEAAYEGKNTDEAYDYANMALELDAKNAQAWLLKVKVLELAAHTEFAKRSEESVACGNRVIALEPSLTEEVYLLWLSHAKGMLDYRIQRIPETTLCAENFDELVPRVMLLRRAIPTEEIAKDDALAKSVVELADALDTYRRYVNKYDEPLVYAENYKYKQSKAEILDGVPEEMTATGDGAAPSEETKGDDKPTFRQRATLLFWGCLAVVIWSYAIIKLLKLLINIFKL